MISGRATADRPEDADARFAAYLADVAAHIDDPVFGEDHRAILADDPQTQRAWFEFAEAVCAAPRYDASALLWTAATILVIAAAVVVVALRVLP